MMKGMSDELWGAEGLIARVRVRRIPQDVAVCR